MISDNVMYIPLLSGILIPIAIILWVQGRRESRESLYFKLLMGAVAIWSLFYLFELLSSEPGSKDFWSRGKYLGVVSIPVLGFSFVCRFIGKERWIGPKNILFLFFIPALTLILIWTNDFHGLFWEKMGPEAMKRLTTPAFLSGSWFWVHIGYTYLLLSIASLLLLIQTVQPHQANHAEMWAVLLAIGAPLAGRAIYAFGNSFFSLIDLTPLGFAVAGIAMAHSLRQYKLPDIIPIAHDLMFKTLEHAAFVLDPQNRVVDLNAKAQQILRIDSSNAIGKPGREVFSRWPEFVNRYRDIDNLNSEICVEGSGIPQWFHLNISPLVDPGGVLLGRLIVLQDLTPRKEVERELQRIQNNLETLVHQRTLELQVANQRLTDEIKERRRTQVILKESEERYRQLVEQPFDGVYVLRGGNIIYINQTGAKILGAKKINDLIGMSILDFVHPTCKEVVEKRIQTISSGEKVVPLAEEKFTRLDGQEIDVEVAGTLLLYEGLASIMVVFRDITERKLAEGRLRLAHEELEARVRNRTADLEKSNRLLQIEIAEREKVEEELRQAKESAETASRSKSDFLANMSHELRTPLNAIIGFSELLLDRESGELNPVQEEYLGDVLQSSRHLLSLINDILDLSKVEAGKMELEIREVSLRELLEGSLVMVKEKALKHRIDLSTELDGIPDVVRGDDRKLKQVVFNLLSNAVKFTPDGGRLVLRGALLCQREGQWMPRNRHREIDREERGPAVAPNGSGVLISVEDTGIGICKENLERIFFPFEQVEGSANRRYQGTGLGLSVSRRIVELHGGTIWAESAGLGKGSTFRFLIPLVPPLKEKEDR
jgi:PAS domain S-box-containing protein